jgi:hypothetical protein
MGSPRPQIALWLPSPLLHYQSLILHLLGSIEVGNESLLWPCIFQLLHTHFEEKNCRDLFVLFIDYGWMDNNTCGDGIGNDAFCF